jgi:predicted lipoprotein with Yx(FWY)xxD motif
MVGLTAVAVPLGAATKPGAPPKPTAAQGNASARVNWTAPAAHGARITGYVVTPFLNGKAQLPRIFTKPARSQTIKGLQNGRSYTFRVAARNRIGLGRRSAASNAVTPTATPTLRGVNNPTFGPIIVDSSGFTLYLFVADGSSPTSTVPAVLKPAWPTTTWSGRVSVGAGLNPGLATAHVQPDGTRQVAYNGHLLYTFVTDTAPGLVTGHNVAGFALISAAGTQVVP